MFDYIKQSLRSGGWSWSGVREKYYWAGWSWRLELERCERKVLFGWSWSNKPNAVSIFFNSVEIVSFEQLTLAQIVLMA
jgi:hypothetical protein